jgi:hypothetical protein
MSGIFGGIIVLPEAGKLAVAGAGLETWERIILEFSHFAAESANTSEDPFKVRSYSDFLKLSNDSLDPDY